ncbi:MAG: hypothetical protein V2B18_20080 [Pseudomonadota bacterium]
MRNALLCTVCVLCFTGVPLDARAAGKMEKVVADSVLDYAARLETLFKVHTGEELARKLNEFDKICMDHIKQLNGRAKGVDTNLILGQILRYKIALEKCSLFGKWLPRDCKDVKKARRRLNDWLEGRDTVNSMVEVAPIRGSECSGIDANVCSK